MKILVLAFLAVVVTAMPSVLVAAAPPSLGIEASFEPIDELQMMCNIKITDLETGDPVAGPRLVGQISKETRATMNIMIEEKEYKLLSTCMVDKVTATYMIVLSDEGGEILTEKSTVIFGPLAERTGE